jgi:methylenetetrahydrofolate reductase (NADPH)
MSAVAAASLVAAEGVEPILHMVSRDRNRIALVSDCLGAQALGIRNLFCTTGTHQTLAEFKAAKIVYDIDSTQLLAVCAGLAADGAVVGHGGFAGAGPFCLGAAAAPDADPLDLQVMRLAKKAAAGAHFVVTEPVFDLDRFKAWWEGVTERGLHEKLAILAGIRPLATAESARAYAAKRPAPRIPAAVLERLTGPAEETAQRAAGMEVALETVKHLSGVKGLRGFQISVNGAADMALELLEKMETP